MHGNHFLKILQNIDRNIFLIVNQKIHTPFFDFFFTQLTRLGDFYLLWLLISLLLMIFGKKKEKNTGLLSLLAIVINAFVTNFLLQPFFNRFRPYDVLKNVTLLVPKTIFLSFPSGHASGAFAFATIIYARYRRFWWLYMLAFLIAFSRIYVGVHYPADVFAGTLVGITVALFVLLSFRFLRMVRNRTI
jgi:undecaprenyl-diphosphatase